MTSSCTSESHADIKNDPRRWATELDPIGELDAGNGRVLRLANCKACHSTLALELTLRAG